MELIKAPLLISLTFVVESLTTKRFMVNRGAG